VALQGTVLQKRANAKKYVGPQKVVFSLNAHLLTKLKPFKTEFCQLSMRTQWEAFHAPIEVLFSK